MNFPSPLANRYRLREIVGLGGMSEVHLAHDVVLDRDVAIKILDAGFARDPNVAARFRREAQRAAGLNHPAIAAVYDAGEASTSTGSLLYIVMEYVAGATLRDILRAQGPMAASRAIALSADVCQALECSHRQGIIHRDIKPANILISQAGAVKVVDFGIARALAHSDTSVTQTGAVLGTAQYLSPEQARGDRVDARSDIYSLGCVLYETATGEPPFIGESAVSLAYQHVRETPCAPSRRNRDLSPDFDSVVLKALAKRPEDRYQSAADFRADLLRVESGDAPDVARSASRWPRAVAGLVVVAVVSAVAIVVLRQTPRQAEVPDVQGKVSADAISLLDDRGLHTRIRQQRHATVPSDHVIETNPAAGAAVAVGGDVTLDVSSGPDTVMADPVDTQTLQIVPEVSSLTYADAILKLTDAGFGRFHQAWAPSPAGGKDRVLGTNPLANHMAATTSEITVVMGSGPVAPPGGR